MSLLTDEIRALIGSTRRYTAPEPLGRAAIRYFAVAIGDDNPLYADADLARRHGLPDVMAPPTLVCETNQYAALPRDADGYAGHTWEVAVPGTRMVRGGNTYTFHRPVHPSDVLTATWRLEGAVERRAATGAAMLVLTSRAEYTNQHAELLVTNEETTILVEVLPGEAP